MFFNQRSQEDKYNHQMAELTGTGIYIIECNANGKRRVYVGQAGVSFKSRMNGHFAQLRAGTHHCKRMQHAFDKYGEESFTFSPLIRVEGKEALTLCEQGAIDKLKTDPSVEVMNTAMVAGSCLGIEHGVEFKERLADARLANWADPEYRERLRLARVQSWAENKEFRAKASERHQVSVEVDGLLIGVYRSTRAAFAANGLPDLGHRTFRQKLKKGYFKDGSPREYRSEDGVVYVFKIVV